ncbi:SDR family oxidoreductase [Rhodococcus fascians]|uniref:SDR family oxidoreductase n=1 Tax=Rhodococcoides fascians TaxID=1828 RepID=UPI001427D74B|nr:SDR family oxidoreductase [Rhodococcus fascians]MBY4140730.1 SDR family oxidoreductase [Rhodococcus fascians]MBY4219472.1 SDR family oxidoreductase [Rhodococcus fascians]MBY4223453.1 SDR family oxidoreductase [Rhodococcus fascians]MBY4234719.1 SDR family oxidoreductase [Rhodococcus fascians]
MTGRLAGKVALVTGAGSVGPGWGNGRASAVRFAQEGATVFAVDLNREALEETVARFDGPEGSIIPLQCDVTDTAAVEAIVSTCVEQAGRIDVLVNNVGGSRAGGPVEMTEEEWNKQLEFNLTTTFLTCKHVLPHMKEVGAGAIVNTASTSGIRWTGAAQAAYAASKAGVIAFTRSVAVQHAPLGIRANTVVPGQLHTPMVEVRLAGQRSGGDVDKLLEQRLSRIPIGFMGDGRDTANVALFLASDEAQFITGTEIVVDGGMSARCD